MRTDVFRQTSIERLASPEELDKLIVVTSRRGWIAALSVLLLLTAAIIWAVFGSIPTKVSGSGILLASGGVRNVIHIGSGRITDIRVKAGDTVRVGDIVARIDRYDVVKSIIEAEEKLELLKGTSVLPHEVAAAQKRVNDLQKEHEYLTSVVSPYRGKVLEVKLNVGDMLSAGESLISVQVEGDAIAALEGILYVPVQEGKKLMPGMEVRLAPSFIKTEEYGFLLGKVVSISEYPATHQRMLSVLGSQELVNMFSAQGAPTEVRVELLSSSKTMSGYTWSTPKGAPVKINSGTICSGSITVERERPINMVIPIRQRLMEMINS